MSYFEDQIDSDMYEVFGTTQRYKKEEVRMDKRCVCSLDGQLLLTVGNLYEVVDNRISGITVVTNDIGETVGYPEQYFVGAKVKVTGITEPIVDPMPPLLYTVGQVLDIRYMGSDSLPNRIKILMASPTEDRKWTYKAQLESTGDVVNMLESWLSPRVKNKTADVYQLNTVINRYESGLRWMGNYNHETASKKFQNITDSGLATPFLREAYNGYGKLLSSQSSIWIKYANKYVINDDGTIGKKKNVYEKAKLSCTMNREECSFCINGKNGHERVVYCVK